MAQNLLEGFKPREQEDPDDLLLGFTPRGDTDLLAGFEPRSIREVEDKSSYTLGDEIPEGIDLEVGLAAAHKPQFIGLQPRSARQELDKFQALLDRQKNESGTGPNPNKYSAFENKPKSFESRKAEALRVWDDAMRYEDSAAKAFIDDVTGNRADTPIEKRDLGAALDGPLLPIDKFRSPDEGALKPLNIIANVMRRLATGAADFSLDEPGAPKTNKDLLFDMFADIGVFGGISAIKGSLKQGTTELLERHIVKELQEIYPDEPRFNTVESLRNFVARFTTKRADPKELVAELHRKLPQTDKLSFDLQNRAPFREVPSEVLIPPISKTDITPLIKGLREGAQVTPDRAVQPLGENAVRNLDKLRVQGAVDDLGQIDLVPGSTVKQPNELMPELRAPTHQGARPAKTDTLRKMGDKAGQEARGNKLYEAIPLPETAHPERATGRVLLDRMLPMDNVLHTQGAEGVVEPIWRSAAESGRFTVKYTDIRKGILKGIRPNSPAAKAIPELLEGQITLEALAKRIGFKEAAKAGQAALRLRNEFFEPIINLLQDPALRKVLGTVDYINAYFPRFKEQLKAAGLTKSEINAILLNLGPDKLKPSIVKTRTGNILKIGYQNDIFKVLPLYQDLASKSLFKLPAYSKAKLVVDAMPESDLKNLARWYTKNYIGHPGLTSEARKKYLKVSGLIGRIYYRSFLGLNIDAATRNATQFMNTMIEHPVQAVRGLGRMATRKGRKEFHESGILADMAIFEQAGLKYGIDKIIYLPFQAAEYMLRGSAYLGAKDAALRQGATPLEALLAGRKLVAKTQFIYDSTSPIWAFNMAGAPVSVFESFTFRQGDFVTRNMAGGLKGVKAIVNGTSTKETNQEVAKMVRMIGAWTAVMTAGGEGTQRMLQFWSDRYSLPMEHAMALVRWGGTLIFDPTGRATFDNTIEGIKDIPQDAIRALTEIIPARKVTQEPALEVLEALGLPKAEQ